MFLQLKDTEKGLFWETEVMTASRMGKTFELNCMDACICVHLHACVYVCACMYTFAFNQVFMLCFLVFQHLRSLLTMETCFCQGDQPPDTGSSLPAVSV